MPYVNKCVLYSRLCFSWIHHVVRPSTAVWQLPGSLSVPTPLSTKRAMRHAAGAVARDGVTITRLLLGAAAGGCLLLLRPWAVGAAADGLCTGA